MPIDARQSYGSIMSELMASWRASGKIGNTRPRNKAHALRIAQAIAASKKGLPKPKA